MTLGGPAKLQVVAESSNIEDVQLRINKSDLAANAAQHIRSRIRRPHHNGHAIGWQPCKIALRQRQINYGMAGLKAILQVAHHANHFIGLLVVPHAPPDRIPISEESARGTLIQHNG